MGEEGKRPGRAEQGPQVITVAQFRLRERERALSVPRTFTPWAFAAQWLEIIRMRPGYCSVVSAVLSAVSWERTAYLWGLGACSLVLLLAD